MKMLFSVVLLRTLRHCRDNNGNQLHAKTAHLVLKQHEHDDGEVRRTACQGTCTHQTTMTKATLMCMMTGMPCGWVARVPEPVFALATPCCLLACTAGGGRVDPWGKSNLLARSGSTGSTGCRRLESGGGLGLRSA